MQIHQIGIFQIRIRNLNRNRHRMQILNGKYQISTRRVLNKPKPIHAPKTQDYRKEHPEMKLGEISKAIGAELKSLDDEEKMSKSSIFAYRAMSDEIKKKRAKKE